MSNELTITESAAAVWGDREEIATIARRLKAMLPGGHRLTDEQTYAAAQYAALTGLDPFAAGFFALPGGGIAQHYAVLVNWAQTVAPYSDRYQPLTEVEKELEGIAADSVAWKCYILRDDRAHLLHGYLAAGMPFTEALDFLAAKGVGIVSKADTTGRNGQAIDPPKGWTWPKVAQKRALRAALALSHGKPTAAELRTIANRLYQKSDAGRLAALEAESARRAQLEAGMPLAQRQERLAANAALLHGPADDWDFEGSAMVDPPAESGEY